MACECHSGHPQESVFFLPCKLWGFKLRRSDWAASTPLAPPPPTPQAPKVREDTAASECEGRGSERQWLTRTRPPGGKRGAVLVLLTGSV